MAVRSGGSPEWVRVADGLAGSRSGEGIAREQWFGVERLWTVLGAEGTLRRIHRDGRPLPSGIDDVEIQSEIRETTTVQQPLLHGVLLHPPQGLHARIFRRASLPQLLDDEEEREVVAIGFAAPG